MNTDFTAIDLASYIDHTLLKADAGKDEILQLCEEAKQYGFYSVCVNSKWVSLCDHTLKGSSVKISAVCGFPLGANASVVKAYEAAYCVENGASEIDMVLPVSDLLAGNDHDVVDDIRKVVSIVQGRAIVKVILETGYLTPDLIVRGCQLAEEAGAHFVKTSTGFGPGGADLETVKRMKESVGSTVMVKASGGIRDWSTAVRMIQAGANRIGTSSGPAIMKERLNLTAE